MATAKYRAQLESVGNPDFRQYAPISDPVDAVGDTVAEVVKVAMDYRDAWELGGGNWTNPCIYRADGSVVGYVSYLGRLWPDEEVWVDDIADIDIATAS